MYLDKAMLCLNCNWIGENKFRCDKCDSVNLYQLVNWLNKNDKKDKIPAKALALR